MPEGPLAATRLTVAACPICGQHNRNDPIHRAETEMVATSQRLSHVHIAPLFIARLY
jgi:hypothetical protein